jgi:hypothetical protein
MPVPKLTNLGMATSGLDDGVMEFWLLFARASVGKNMLESYRGCVHCLRLKVDAASKAAIERLLQLSHLFLNAFKLGLERFYLAVNGLC